MDGNDLANFLQTGFYISLGATATLIEVLQSPAKRDENFSKLQADADRLLADLAEKGAATEVEARAFVDRLIARQVGQDTAATEPPPTTVDTTAAPVVDAPAPDATEDGNLQAELQALTQQIAALRQELEARRDDR